MFAWTVAPITSKGEVVYTGTTRGSTCRFRGGLTVQVIRDDTYSTPSFRVFVADTFVAGWADRNQAVEQAHRY